MPVAGVHSAAGRTRDEPLTAVYRNPHLICLISGLILKRFDWFLTAKMLTDMVVEQEFEIKEEEPWYDKQDLEHGTISFQSLSRNPIESHHSVL